MDVVQLGELLIHLGRRCMRPVRCNSPAKSPNSGPKKNANSTLITTFARVKGDAILIKSNAKINEQPVLVHPLMLQA